MFCNILTPSPNIQNFSNYENNLLSFSILIMCTHRAKWNKNEEEEESNKNTAEWFLVELGSSVQIQLGWVGIKPDENFPPFLTCLGEMLCFGSASNMNEAAFCCLWEAWYIVGKGSKIKQHSWDKRQTKLKRNPNIAVIKPCFVFIYCVKESQFDVMVKPLENQGF